MKQLNFPLAAVCTLTAFMLAGCNSEHLTRLQPTGQIEVDLLVVQMPEAQALPLIPELRDKKRAGKATERITKLVSDGKAKLIGCPVLVTMSGRRAVVEQTDDIRYATDFDSPGRSVVTQSLKKPESASPEAQNEGKSPGATSTTETIAGAESKEAQAAPIPDTANGEELETTTDINHGFPTAFESRKVGVTLEIDPVLSPDGGSINLNIATQHVHLLGMRKASISREGSKEKTIVEQPEFLTNRVTTSFEVVDGEYTLLGIFKVNDPPRTVELFILHTQLQKALVPIGQAKTQ